MWRSCSAGSPRCVAGTTAFGQIERGANRIYGVERDRPPLRKYATAALLFITAGGTSLLAAVLLVAGETLARLGRPGARRSRSRAGRSR